MEVGKWSMYWYVELTVVEHGEPIKYWGSYGWGASKLESGGYFWFREWVLEWWTYSAFIIPREVHAILRIQALEVTREDSVIWRHARSGEYAVRSAYNFIMHNFIDYRSFLKVKRYGSFVRHLG